VALHGSANLFINVLEQHCLARIRGGNAARFLPPFWLADIHSDNGCPELHWVPLGDAPRDRGGLYAAILGLKVI
jgi:hypothetical protein